MPPTKSGTTVAKGFKFAPGKKTGGSSDAAPSGGAGAGAGRRGLDEEEDDQPVASRRKALSAYPAVDLGDLLAETSEMPSHTARLLRLLQLAVDRHRDAAIEAYSGSRGVVAATITEAGESFLIAAKKAIVDADLNDSAEEATASNPKNEANRKREDGLKNDLKALNAEAVEWRRIAEAHRVDEVDSDDDGAFGAGRGGAASGVKRKRASSGDGDEDEEDVADEDDEDVDPADLDAELLTKYTEAENVDAKIATSVESMMWALDTMADGLRGTGQLMTRAQAATAKASLSLRQQAFGGASAATTDAKALIKGTSGGSSTAAQLDHALQNVRRLADDAASGRTPKTAIKSPSARPRRSLGGLSATPGRAGAAPASSAKKQYGKHTVSPAVALAHGSSGSSAMSTGTSGRAGARDSLEAGTPDIMKKIAGKMGKRGLAAVSAARALSPGAGGSQ